MPLVTVTCPPTGAEDRRPVVVLTSRVHPGETPASWVMRGVLHHLTGDSQAAHLLRKTLVFKLVPMINPDGVIVGNTRCNLAAADLNRQYKDCVREAFPTVHAVRELVAGLVREGRCVLLYCDMHAHNREYNVFMYGCENRRKSSKHLTEQVFPYMLAKNAKNIFSFEGCRFTVPKCKESTARVVFKNMGITNSFTLEASYGGSSVGSRAGSHFTPRDYQDMGRYFSETVLDFSDLSPAKEVLRQKMHLSLLKQNSSAAAPSNGYVSGYSTLSSSEEDASEVETMHSAFLFQRVQKKTRRRPKKKLSKLPKLAITQPTKCKSIIRDEIDAIQDIHIELIDLHRKLYAMEVKTIKFLLQVKEQEQRRVEEQEREQEKARARWIGQIGPAGVLTAIRNMTL